MGAPNDATFTTRAEHALERGVTPPIPTGTVTFLFTDVEGSTRIWEANPDVMAGALARHDEILRGVLEGHGGHIFSTAGDSFSAAFGRVADAVAAASEAQEALHAEAWPDGGLIKVRIGLHTGEADERVGLGEPGRAHRGGRPGDGPRGAFL